MTQDELKLVLDALKFCHGGEPCGTAEAIAVVEKALAQPEQEPVAWVWVNNKGWLTYGETPHDMFKSSPLFESVEQLSKIAQGLVRRKTELSQTKRKPLTDEEIDRIYTGIRAVHHEIDSYVFARAIEAAHGIKENHAIN